MSAITRSFFCFVFTTSTNKSRFKTSALLVFCWIWSIAQNPQKITINSTDCTIKTEFAETSKQILCKDNLVYMWYANQKVYETTGGFSGRILHGSYAAFYLSGQLKESGKLKYGTKHKTWKTWYPDGKIKEITTWKNGIKTGSYSLYNDEGNRMVTADFKNNKLHGKFLTYNQFGQIIEIKKFKNGIEVKHKSFTKSLGPKIRNLSRSKHSPKVKNKKSDRKLFQHIKVKLHRNSKDRSVKTETENKSNVDAKQ